MGMTARASEWHLSCCFARHRAGQRSAATASFDAEKGDTRISCRDGFLQGTLSVKVIRVPAPDSLRSCLRRHVRRACAMTESRHEQPGWNEEPERRCRDARLGEMLECVRRSNPFYRQKLAGVSIDALPFTTRAEMQQDQLTHPPYGTNLTFPRAHYVRMHQTSGTSTTPLRWLDTAESWAWFRNGWRLVLECAGFTAADRVLVPFSFGPFIGFWGGFEAAIDLGCFVLPAGGMTTSARLQYLLDHAVTAICCTPTYALRLAEVAAAEGLNLSASPVRTLVVAGEPGGSIPATRRRLETAWGASVFDHSGMTEIGAYGFQCGADPTSMHILETEFIAEVIDPVTAAPVADGGEGELVLTNLGRWGSPLIRYRTGDLVRMIRSRCACGRWFARLQGGILGRADDMLVVRGNNVFPSTIEGILREFDEVAEFAIVTGSTRPLTELAIAVEPRAGVSADGLVERIVSAMRDRLHFRPKVRLVEPGSLPRSEMKARRVIREASE